VPKVVAFDSFTLALASAVNDRGYNTPLQTMGNRSNER